jgi:hypothetical protein
MICRAADLLLTNLVKVKFEAICGVEATHLIILIYSAFHFVYESSFFTLSNVLGILRNVLGILRNVLCNQTNVLGLVCCFVRDYFGF